MSLISTTIPNLVNGVSQQPYALRLASQADGQINAYSSVVDGLRKRPPTRHSAHILDTPLPDAYIHTINRDANERYVVVITNGGLRVFDLNGHEKTVHFPHGTGYLSADAPREQITAVSVADHTFIVNKTIQVQANLGDIVPGRPNEALIWVRQGAYGARYEIWLGGAYAAFETPDGSTASHSKHIATDHIAAQLCNKLIEAGIRPEHSYDVGRYGSVIHITSWQNNFGVAVADSVGDTVLKLVKGSVQRFSDLPAKAVGGFRARVAGSSENAFDDYYVEYQADGTNPNGGVWKEAMKAGEHRSFYGHTMPHLLVRNADGTFTFKAADWASRAVGDLNSCPMPSFVGRRISDIFFHRNRLGFLADENVVFSRAGEFFNFFPASAIQTLDTDPVDAAVSHVKVSLLRHAIPFNENLLLFSDQTQFTYDAGELLTPRTVSINQTTEFECSLRAKPVGAGVRVYFAVTRGEYSAIREYYVDGETKTNDAADITAHCPGYIPKGVIKLAASSNEDVLVALSEQAPNTIFVYRYYWNGADKLQSSWSKWVFGKDDRILNCDFIESSLWMVISRPDGTYIECLSLEPGRTDLNHALQVHLDRLVSNTQVSDLKYDESSGTTTFSLPYTPVGNQQYQLVAWYDANGQSYKAGQVVSYKVEGRNVTANGRLNSFFFGQVYEMRYVFSTLIIREDATGGGGQQPIGAGRVQLRKMILTYNNAGYFRVEVTPFGRNTYQYHFSGRIIGSGKNRLGDIALEEGTFSFPISARNDQVSIQIINDSWLPSAFLSAEWEAFFALRSKRL